MSDSTLLDLLDCPDDLAGALEECLVSPRLLELVGELELVQDTSRQDTSGLRLDARLAEILQSGLAALSEDEMRLLLRQPRVLLPLQKAVLLEGGPYWDEVVLRSREPVRPAAAPVEREAKALPWYRSPWAWTANALTALAAAIAVIVIGSRSSTELERQLAQQRVQAESLARDLADLRLMHPPSMPADLPDDPVQAAAPPDPLDLPEGDPNDLPEAPKSKRANVEL